MDARNRKSYRFPGDTLAKAAELAVKWGGIAPATETAVFVRSIELAHAAEFGDPPKATKAKPRAKS